MAGDTLTTLQTALKRNYAPTMAKSTLLNNNMFRLFQDVSKGLKMGGQDWALYQPILTRHSFGGGSGSEGGEFAALDTVGLGQWQLGVARKHSSAGLTGDVIDNIRKAPNLSYFEDIINVKMDSIKDTLAVSLGWQIFGKGDGAIARVDTGQGAITATGFYVDNPGPEWLQEGMMIQGWDNNTTGGTAQLTDNTSAYQRIAALTYDASTGKTLVTISGTTGLSDNDYIYQRGDYGLAALTGLLGMVDDGTNLAVFQGATRSASPWANAHVFNASSAPLNESLVMSVLEQLVKRSPTKKITHIVTDPTSFNWLALTLVDRQRFEGTKLMGGWSTIRYQTPFGDVEITPDPLCPSGYMFFLDANELGLGWGTKPGGQWFDEGGDVLKPLPASGSGTGYSDNWVMTWRAILQAMLMVPKSCAVMYGYTAP